MLDLPSKTKELVFTDNKGTEKKYEIKFPNTGKLFDIQSYKAKLLKGELGAILNSDTIDGNYVSVLADTISHFTYVCPKLLQDLNVTSINELDALDSAKLVKVY